MTNNFECSYCIHENTNVAVNYNETTYESFFYNLCIQQNVINLLFPYNFNY